MRVLVFSTDDHLHPAGGAEQAFGNISERMPDVEFDLICAKLRKGATGYEQVKNVHIHRMGFGVPKLDGIILALFGHFCAYKLMKKNRYDLIWSVMATYGAFSAVRVKKKTGLPFLLTLQEGDSLEYIYERVKYVRRSFNEIFQVADAIQAISTFLSNWGTEMGFRGKQNSVIPNGVALDAFTQKFGDAEIATARAAFGFPENAFVLITSSRLEKKNGVGDVIAALALLPPEVCFVICGGGSLESSLKAMVKEYGLLERVKFMGFVEPQRLPLLMQASDAFIRPSLTEGLGNAFLEAMATRIVVFGTNAGGIPDFLTHGETGFVVGIQDPSDIAQKIKTVMLLHPQEKEAILDRASTLVHARYDWNLVARDMRVLFDTLTT